MYLILLHRRVWRVTFENNCIFYVELDLTFLCLGLKGPPGASNNLIVRPSVCDLMCLVGMRGVAGLIPGGDIYILILNCSLVFRSPQHGGAHANEIMHDHSTVVHVVLSPVHMR